MGYTTWGEWTEKALMCEGGTEIIGFRLRVEKRVRGDNTALNGIQLKCTNHKITTRIDGIWGDWKTWKTCQQGSHVDGVNFRSQEVINGDNSAGINVKMRCTDGHVLDGEGLDIGKWVKDSNGFESCGQGYHLCGVNARIQKWRKDGGDDTALNQLKFFCCKGPSTGPSKWRRDGRCGSKYPLPNGDPAECDPQSIYPCCSKNGWCGRTNAHCTCGKCVDYRSSTNGESKCPESHPHAYKNGDYCCKYGLEKVYKKYGAKCDGGPIGIDSECCRGDKYAPCPHGKCTSSAIEGWIEFNTEGKRCNDVNSKITVVRPRTPEECRRYCAYTEGTYCVWKHVTADGTCISAKECTDRQLLVKSRFTVWKREKNPFTTAKLVAEGFYLTCGLISVFKTNPGCIDECKKVPSCRSYSRSNNGCYINSLLARDVPPESRLVKHACPNSCATVRNDDFTYYEMV